MLVFSREIKTTVTVAVPHIEASSSQNQDVGERNPPDADAAPAPAPAGAGAAPAGAGAGAASASDAGPATPLARSGKGWQRGGGVGVEEGGWGVGARPGKLRETE